ncbi:hypothetical protein L1049_018027 [Liquidambar formosana]|uniref:TF-B3 domain-containing protein n=1 Tax=Liquidambar formosana TaxID=63359 RepID=A0AAP0NI12_LIQFO
MDSLACKPNGKAENHQMEDLQAHPLLLKPTTTEMQGDEFWPLSGKPYFHIILTRSHVKPLYQMVIPAKIHSVLPSATIPVVLTYRDKNWEAVYHGEHRSHKRFNHSWKTFVNDNNLKTGDACVFELMECNSRNLKFRVQVLRGDIPSKLLDKLSSMFTMDDGWLIYMITKYDICKTKWKFRQRGSSVVRRSNLVAS